MDQASGFETRITKIIRDHDIKELRRKRKESLKGREEELRKEQEDSKKIELQEMYDRYISFKSKALLLIPVMETVKALLVKEGYDCGIRSEPGLEQLRSDHWERQGQFPDQNMKIELVMTLPTKSTEEDAGQPYFSFELEKVPILSSYSIVRGYRWRSVFYRKYRQVGYCSRKEVDLEELSKETLQSNISSWLNKTLRLRAYYDQK